MIEGLENLLKSTQEPGLSELRRTLCRLLDQPANALQYVAAQPLGSRVYRLQFTTGGATRTVVVKRLRPLEARRSERVARHWLPAMGLEAAGPGLLEVAATADGDWVWHVYQDHGDNAMVGRESDTASVAAAVKLIACIHSRFASHSLLAECRAYASFDISWFTGNLRDAIQSLHGLRPPRVVLDEIQAALRDRLLARLRWLLEDTPRRKRALAEWGGPETLVHGDLWTSNVFVVPSPDGLHARLIDWDRVGVGPISYDLSAFLLRFPARQRRSILHLYARSLEPGVWQLPGDSHLNLMFETAELSRYANCVIWPALAIARERALWGFDALAEVERWFDALEPVIPPERAQSPGRLQPAARIGGS